MGQYADGGAISRMPEGIGLNFPATETANPSSDLYYSQNIYCHYWHYMMSYGRCNFPRC